jgi:hypothetical protein
MRMRREPEDDFLHAADADPNFNESRYYNVFDRGTGLGAWMRMGNRPNEAYAEMTVCLYLPDGRVGFMFKRPRIEGHHAHDSGGLRFEVIAPYEQHRVTYDGDVCLLADPREMADPGSAFAKNPHERCTIDLHLTALAEASGGEPEWEEGEQRAPGSMHEFARGHTEQHMAITGVVQVGALRFDLTAGLGLRDHSWGPRVWQSIWWYRWITASFGPLGFACTIRGEQDKARPHVSGHVFDLARHGAELVAVRDMALTSEYDDAGFPTRNTVAVTTDHHVYELQGEIWSSIPLRNRRNGQVTRLTESMTRWSCGDLVGAGLSEYLDQVVDDVPVGIAAGH